MTKGSITYRERRERKAERLREWAEMREAKAEALRSVGEEYRHVRQQHRQVEQRPPAQPPAGHRERDARCLAHGADSST